MKRAILMLATLATLGTLSGVQSAVGQQDALRLTITSVTEDAYPNARLLIGAEDTSGAPAEFGVEAWSVAVNGAPATVLSAELASSEDAPLDVAIVVDTSGSMEGAPLAAAKTAAKAFIAELRPNDRVALIRFGNDVQLVQDFTADRALVSGAIDALVAQGNTVLYSATVQAATQIAASPASRRAVILLSDGADFGGRSTATRDEAIYASASSGVPFFVIAQGSDLDRPYLQQLADVTRGRYLEAPNPGDLEALYVGIGRLLRSQYVITFDASGAAPAASNAITVTLNEGGRAATAETQFAPSAGFAPTITLEGITAGDDIRSPREITLDPGTAGAPEVTWYVDDVNVLEQNEPPYVFVYDPAHFGEGAHELRVAVGRGATPVEQTLAFSSVPPPPASSGGSPLLIYVGIGGLVGLIAAGLFFYLRARRKPVDRPIPADQRTRSWAQQIADRTAALRAADAEPISQQGAPEQIGEALGLLISRAGTDLGQEYDVGGKPISVGSGYRCGVRIDDPSLAYEEARVWIRDGHLMLHKFTRLTALELQGQVGGWQILEPGDTFQIGQHTFEFKLLPAGESARDGARDAADALKQQRSRFSDLMPRAD